MGTDWWYKIRRGFLCSASVHMSFFHLFPTFSSFSRQTDIHGCSWSIGKALGISEHWQLQVHCYFLSTEGPRMTTFVRGTKAVVYWCLLPSWPRDFLMAQEERNCFLQRLKFPQSRSAANHRDTMTWTQRQNAQSMLRQSQNVSNPFAKLTTSLTPVSDEKVLCYSIKYCCGDRQEHETEEDHASMC
jgi:hypothetical protein